MSQKDDALAPHVTRGIGSGTPWRAKEVAVMARQRRLSAQTKMTPRKRLVALVLLGGVVAVSAALASRSDIGFTVTSTLDGKTVLPVRIQWIATPQNVQNVSEVDYFIDGYHAWTEHTAPYQFASDGDYLVTTFLKPGQI